MLKTMRLMNMFRFQLPLLLPAMSFSLLAFVMHKSTTTKTMCLKDSTIRRPIFDNSSPPQVPGVFAYSGDRYGGVIIDSTLLPTELDTYTETLKTSLRYWKENSKRGIWLKIPIDKVDFVAPAVKEGFVFHHAEKGYIMLNHWLSDSEENKLPANASHQVGVGSVVVSNGKLLLVQEKSGPLRGTGIWKLPTGLSDAGEDIADAAMREVLEETGIETEFVSILSFRQNHGALFGKSDLFFVCLLHPKSTAITIQPSEISVCEWVDPEVYINQPFFKSSGIYGQINTHIRDIVLSIDKQQKHDQQQQQQATASTVAAEAGSTVAFNASPATVAAPLPPAGSMVLSKLPVGFRPGMNALYHPPLVPTTTAAADTRSTATTTNSSTNTDTGL